MAARRVELALRFERQHAFAAGYSPLYARIFGIVAGWLSAEHAQRDPMVNWLVETSRDRATLDVSLLLAAGLHRAVLARETAAMALVPYFPTAGGNLLPDSTEFETALRESLMAGKESISSAIRQGKVQTNETGRGLCWLLPAMMTGWPRIHLVDLGASAGLNLVADRRSFQLEASGFPDKVITLGRGTPAQFITHCSGNLEIFNQLRGKSVPEIVSRTGCDIAPFSLRTEEDELTLKAFIWGDHVDRLDRLCEGIDAFHQIQSSNAPVELYQCRLPDELGKFLTSRIQEDSSPVVLYNTYMTAYLPEKGAGMFDQIEAWAAGQDRAVMWLQWEPARDGREAPAPEMIAWSADLWRSGKHSRWLIGWVHPHGGEVVIVEGGSSS